MIAEVLAVNPGPDEPPVGVYVDLADTQFGGRQVLLGINPLSAFERATRGVDPLDFLLWDRG